MEATKKIPAGCGLFAAHATSRSKTCMLSSTVETSFIEHSRKFHRGESCWFGTMTNTLSFMEFLWECRIMNSSENLVRSLALNIRFLSPSLLNKQIKVYVEVCFENLVYYCFLCHQSLLLCHQSAFHKTFKNILFSYVMFRLPLISPFSNIFIFSSTSKTQFNQHTSQFLRTRS